MRIQRLDVTDFVAGMLVAGATTIYAAGLAGANIGGVRAQASAVFLFGMLACGVGARRDAFFGEGAQARSVAALTAVGVMTLIVGVTAMILGSSEYLTALMIGIWALWIGATIRHLITPPRPIAPAEVAPRLRRRRRLTCSPVG